MNVKNPYRFGKNPLLEGLLTYWELDAQPYTDKLGTYDATVSGGTLETLKQQVGAGCAYTPTDGNLIKFDVSDNVFNFNNGSNDLPFTIGYWHEITFVNTTYGAQLLNKLNFIPNTNTLDWSFSINTARKLQFKLLTDNSNYIAIESPSIIPVGTNTWNHLVATYDGSELASGMKIYLNGVELSSVDISSGTFTGIRNGGSEIWLGSGVATSGNYARARSGWHDDVKVWNRDLPLNQIVLDYDNGIAGIPLF